MPGACAGCDSCLFLPLTPPDPGDEEVSEEADLTTMLMTGSVLLAMVLCSAIARCIFCCVRRVRRTVILGAPGNTPAVPSAMDDEPQAADPNEYPADWTPAQVIKHIREKQRASKQSLRMGGRSAKRVIQEDDSDTEMGSNLGLNPGRVTI